MATACVIGAFGLRKTGKVGVKRSERLMGSYDRANPACIVETILGTSTAAP